MKEELLKSLNTALSQARILRSFAHDETMSTVLGGKNNSMMITIDKFELADDIVDTIETMIWVLEN